MEFLSDPTFQGRLVIALAAVILGTGLFGTISYYRDKRDARRRKALEFLESAGDNFNAAMSRIFGQIRRQEIEIDKRLNELVGRLYEHRFRVQINSAAILRSPNFYPRYMQIIDEVWVIRNTLASFGSRASESVGSLRIVKPEEIPTRSRKIQAKWGVKPKERGGFSSPFAELDEWTNTVWQYASRLISDETRRFI